MPFLVRIRFSESPPSRDGGGAGFHALESLCHAASMHCRRIIDANLQRFCIIYVGGHVLNLQLKILAPQTRV